MIQKLRKALLISVKYILSILTSMFAILGSSFLSIYLSTLAAGRKYTLDVGIPGGHQYQYPDIAIFVGFWGYIIIFPSVLFFVKETLNLSNKILYWTGTILGIPYFFLHIVILYIRYG